MGNMAYVDFITYIMYTILIIMLHRFDSRSSLQIEFREIWAPLYFTVFLVFFAYRFPNCDLEKVPAQKRDSEKKV